MRGPLVAVLLVAGVTVAPAHAAPAAVLGNPCTIVSTESADAPGEWTGVLFGRLEKLTGIAGSPTVSGRLTCSLEVGREPKHSDPDLARTQSDVTTGVALVAPPVPVTYHRADLDNVVACAQVDLTSGETYYLTEFAGWYFWSTYPDALCDDTASVGLFPPPPAGRPLAMAISLANSALIAAGSTLEIVDTVVCPQLVALAPGAGPVTIDATGDTYVDGELWWDCPPYQPATAT